jgi:hypothetical protein
MVKNQHGGNKSKKMGRKFVTAPVDRRLRLVEDEDEKYAVVTKLLGNGMCYVDAALGSGTSEMICIIRKKFKGRGKRDNTLNIGTLLLIGVRSWEVLKGGSKPKCDLLEVYNEGEINKLKKGGHINVLISKLKDESESDIIFEDEQTTNYKNIIENNLDAEELISGPDLESVEDDFDFDDI